MFGLENATGLQGAGLVMGVVLLEAIILYIGYGALERLFGPTLVKMVSGE
ncbi:hypothetical protein JCM30237_06570 [Halolamina litorea]|uniref:ABC transporter permease n=1 Tax=Halolamina litorea TaxID=1515593 RepID=A0ABD6BPZ0_9EURY|nr:hypothetical protein [Halolamina litorea]